MGRITLNHTKIPFHNTSRVAVLAAGYRQVRQPPEDAITDPAAPLSARR
ncbi:hypothetical protein KCP76_17130 [Salmonella enterica subsp. enterica serovar Weltevreden]|nr:hypothetical protein KCP76_17130 [Salmonella enterica subsp. enterica serovar Weltevreden]